MTPSAGHWLVTILRRILHSLVPRWAHLCTDTSPQRKVLELDGYVVGQRLWVCREVIIVTIVIKLKGQECKTSTLCVVAILYTSTYTAHTLRFHFNPGVDPHVLGKRYVKPSEPNQLALMSLHCLDCL